MIYGPMTFLVLVTVAVMLVAGVWLLLRALGRSSRGARRCPDCQSQLRGDARYCAGCGRRVDAESSS